MTSHKQKNWNYRHGSLNAFCADPEFCNASLEKLLRSHNAELQFRPAHFSNNNDKIEKEWNF